jgi:hypothetical protein
MRFRLSLLLLLAGTSFAHAQSAALDDDKKPARTTDPTAAPDTTAVAEKVEWGADIRVRSVWVPQGMINLFVEHSPGGIQGWGWGFDAVRRRGNSELQIGFEHENLPPPEGVWINKGDNVPADSADYILSPDHAPGGSTLGWYTLEFTFINHAVINKYVSFRYGGGAGLGIISGDLYRWDVQCAATATNANPDPGCVPGDKFPGRGQGQTADDSGGAPENNPVKYNLPPVFPVVNAIIGLQIKPIPKAVINIEGGIRTLPFFGFSAGYFF